eukprot:Hpha_TRINITY_DN40_c0_g1::TRINITY_DN40_c0_g1_i1::g.110062::m.110062
MTFEEGLRPLAARSKILKGEGTIATLQKAQEWEKAGHSVMHMEVGDPDFKPPEHIMKAVQESLERGETHYSPAGGPREAKEVVAEYFRTRRGLKHAHADNVMISPGGKPVIFHTLCALLESGDEAIYPNPGFPAYETTIEYTGAKPVPLPLEESRGFQFDPAVLEGLITPRTKLLILNSPQNPTGGMLEGKVLEAVAALCVKHKLWVLSDEIYGEMVMDDDCPHVSIATYPGMAERTVVLDGCSKTFAMTGFRCGFGLFPPALTRPVHNLAINSWTCIPVFTLRGMMAALTGPWDAVEKMRAAYRERREVVVSGLNSLPGVSCATPKGAFYCLANITKTGMTATEFADKALQHGVSLLPATYFGEHGTGFVRLSFANNKENLSEGIDRLRKMLS